MEKRKFQQSIDSHFQWTVQLKSGEVVNLLPSKLKNVAPDVEAQLIAKFKEQRKEGRRVSARWFKKKATQIAKELQKEDFKASKGWFYMFLKRNNLSLRKKTNSKKASVVEKRPDIQRFHSKLCLVLGTGTNVHPKWGCFLPKNRWNVDQVPMPFSCVPGETYEDKKHFEYSICCLCSLGGTLSIASVGTTNSR